MNISVKIENKLRSIVIHGVEVEHGFGDKIGKGIFFTVYLVFSNLGNYRNSSQLFFLIYIYGCLCMCIYTYIFKYIYIYIKTKNTITIE